jgi:hypothetical protein
MTTQNLTCDAGKKFQSSTASESYEQLERLVSSNLDFQDAGTDAFSLVFGSLI